MQIIYRAVSRDTNCSHGAAVMSVLLSTAAPSAVPTAVGGKPGRMVRQWLAGSIDIREVLDAGAELAYLPFGTEVDRTGRAATGVVERAAAPPSTPAVPASIARRDTECRRTVF